MKAADVTCQCGCGRLVVQPRGGGPRKRFFENACRARWTRRGKQAKRVKRQVLPEPDERQATLERLYELLKADVETEGTLIPSGPGGAMKGNPSAALLVRVIAELDRRQSAPIEQEESDVVATLHAI